MADSVGEPGEQVEDGVGVRREDVGQVGAVEDILEGGKDLDPDMRPVLDRDEAFGNSVLADGDGQAIAIGAAQEARLTDCRRSTASISRWAWTAGRTASSRASNTREATRSGRLS